VALALALIWCLLQLTQTVVVLIVGLLLAVTLSPAVLWLQGHRWPRGLAAGVVCLALVAVLVGSLWFAWSAAVEQSGQVVKSFQEVATKVAPHLPPSLRDSLTASTGRTWSTLGSYALGLARSASTAGTILLLSIVLTFYFLLDGERVRDWLLAFAPQRHRARARRTVEEGQEVLMAYVVGNTITSVIAAISTFIALSLMGVPAALFLALLAGLLNFIPVVGLIISAIPALALAATVSTQTLVLVVLFYAVYNGVENYFLAPWAYGSRMKLSDVAIILSFVVGAELAGVIGALIALPIAALYPTVERIWLREQLPLETVVDHRVLEEGGDVRRETEAPPSDDTERRRRAG
jgi:predicted PurR-regulated permease PerM